MKVSPSITSHYEEIYNYVIFEKRSQTNPKRTQFYSPREVGLIFFEVEGLCRKCELDGLGLEAFHNLEINLLVHLVIEPVIRRFYPIAHIEIQRAVVEIAEVHPRRIIRVGINFRSACKNVFYDFGRAILHSFYVQVFLYCV